MDTMRNWLALFIAITNFSEVGVDGALERAYGYYRFKLDKEKITPDKVRHVIKCMEKRPTLRTIELLVTRLRLAHQTILDIWRVTMAGRKILTDEQVERIIFLLDQGASFYRIRKEICVSPITLSIEMQKRGYNPDKYSYLQVQQTREEKAVIHTRRAKAYWNSFTVGDRVAARKKIKYKGEKEKIVKVVGTITFVSPRIMQIISSKKERRLMSINFTEVVNLDIMLKKICHPENAGSRKTDEN